MIETQKGVYRNWEYKVLLKMFIEKGSGKNEKQYLSKISCPMPHSRI